VEDTHWGSNPSQIQGTAKASKMGSTPQEPSFYKNIYSS